MEASKDGVALVVPQRKSFRTIRPPKRPYEDSDGDHNEDGDEDKAQAKNGNKIKKQHKKREAVLGNADNKKYKGYAYAKVRTKYYLYPENDPEYIEELAQSLKCAGNVVSTRSSNGPRRTKRAPKTPDTFESMVWEAPKRRKPYEDMINTKKIAAVPKVDNMKAATVQKSQTKKSDKPKTTSTIQNATKHKAIKQSKILSSKNKTKQVINAGETAIGRKDKVQAKSRADKVKKSQHVATTGNRECETPPSKSNESIPATVRRQLSIICTTHTAETLGKLEPEPNGFNSITLSSMISDIPAIGPVTTGVDPYGSRKTRELVVPSIPAEFSPEIPGDRPVNRPKRPQIIRRGVVYACRWLCANNGKGDSRLQSLNLGGEFITTAGFKLLAKALERNEHLRELFIYNTNLQYEGMKALTTALLSNRYLSSINLGENTMDAKTIALLVDLLRKSPTINSLYLDWGVANQDVKNTIRRLLHPANRERLWIEREGAVPDHAREIIGHHSGRFHVEKGKQGLPLKQDSLIKGKTTTSNASTKVKGLLTKSQASNLISTTTAKSDQLAKAESLSSSALEHVMDDQVVSQRSMHKDLATTTKGEQENTLKLKAPCGPSVTTAPNMNNSAEDQEQGMESMVQKRKWKSISKAKSAGDQVGNTKRSRMMSIISTENMESTAEHDCTEEGPVIKKRTYKIIQEDSTKGVSSEFTKAKTKIQASSNPAAKSKRKTFTNATADAAAEKPKRRNRAKRRKGAKCVSKSDWESVPGGFACRDSLSSNVVAFLEDLACHGVSWSLAEYACVYMALTAPVPESCKNVLDYQAANFVKLTQGTKSASQMKSFLRTIKGRRGEFIKLAKSFSEEEFSISPDNSKNVADDSVIEEDKVPASLIQHEVEPELNADKDDFEKITENELISLNTSGKAVVQDSSTSGKIAEEEVTEGDTESIEMTYKGESSLFESTTRSIENVPYPTSTFEETSTHGNRVIVPRKTVATVDNANVAPLSSDDRKCKRQGDSPIDLAIDPVVECSVTEGLASQNNSDTIASQKGTVKEFVPKEGDAAESRHTIIENSHYNDELESSRKLEAEFIQESISKCHVVEQFTSEAVMESANAEKLDTKSDTGKHTVQEFTVNGCIANHQESPGREERLITNDERESDPISDAESEVLVVENFTDVSKIKVQVELTLDRDTKTPIESARELPVTDGISEGQALGHELEKGELVIHGAIEDVECTKELVIDDYVEKEQALQNDKENGELVINDDFEKDDLPEADNPKDELVIADDHVEDGAQTYVDKNNELVIEDDVNVEKEDLFVDTDADTEKEENAGCF